MNVAVGIVAGILIGWLAYRVAVVDTTRGLGYSLMVAVVGGGVGGYLAPAINANAAIDGQIDLFSLLVSSAGAVGCLVVAHMIRRSGRP